MCETLVSVNLRCLLILWRFYLLISTGLERTIGRKVERATHITYYKTYATTIASCIYGLLLSFSLADINEYDMKCKVEPLQRSLKEAETDAWINGRRRDHGFERAMLPVWEGTKINPLAFWSFEDCWNYLRKGSVPYHPLHDVGFSSVGDMHSTRKVPLEKWFSYGGERSGRFEGLKNKDGSFKTECEQ